MRTTARLHFTRSRARPRLVGSVSIGHRAGWFDTSGDVPFVRIGTSPRAFTNPMTLSEASERVKSWLARRITQVLQPDADHVDRVLSLLAAAHSAGGNLVTDAQIAAHAMAYRAVVHTADRDFLRFPELTCYYPLD